LRKEKERAPCSLPTTKLPQDNGSRKTRGWKQSQGSRRGTQAPGRGGGGCAEELFRFKSEPPPLKEKKGFSEKRWAAWDRKAKLIERKGGTRGKKGKNASPDKIGEKVQGPADGNLKEEKMQKEGRANAGQGCELSKRGVMGKVPCRKGQKNRFRGKKAGLARFAPVLNKYGGSREKGARGKRKTPRKTKKTKGVVPRKLLCPEKIEKRGWGAIRPVPRCKHEDQ